MQELQLSAPLTVKLVFDQTVYIDDALNLVLNNIWQGGLLAVITLMVFLRSWRSIVIVGTSVPLAVIATVVVMLSMGRTINVVSLAGLAFAIGTLIDNSIVVLENIHRHLSEGESPFAAALNGRNEIGMAAMAITFTDIVVYIPVAFTQGNIGQLFIQYGLTIVVATMPGEGAVMNSSVKVPGVRQRRKRAISSSIWLVS